MRHMKKSIRSERAPQLYLLMAVLLTVALASACRTKELTKERLITMIDHDKELTQTQEINGIKVTAKYVPSQLIVQQELEGMKPGDSVGPGALEKRWRAGVFGPCGRAVEASRLPDRAWRSGGRVACL